jgi:hypothetical protein
MGGRRLCNGDGYITTFIVYGLITNPETVIKNLNNQSNTHNSDLSSSLAIINDGTPGLRLNSQGWTYFKNAGPIDIDSTSRMFEIIREKIRAKISPFSKTIHRFIHDYLEFIETQVQKINISEPETELFKQYDWVFSAWLPLTHSYILISDPNDKTTMEFAEFDICFWTGKKLLCICVGKSRSMIKSKQKKIDFLKHNNPLVEIINIPSETGLVTEEKFSTELFGLYFQEFWTELNLPLGPNQPPILSKYFSNQNIK